MYQKSILVIFGKDLPKKNKKWFGRFDKVLMGKELEEFMGSGSIQQAFELVNRISGLTLPDGSRLSKLINYQGYELWWMNYDSIYNDFCLPYTQYHKLLEYLKKFDKIYLFEAPWPELFQYFLKANNRQCVILKKFRWRSLLPFPLGVFIQVILSVLFLPLLKITKPQLMVWASDKFDPPRDHDFRMRFIFEELRQKEVRFVEFIRSLESWPVVLRHAWRRKRPVFYSTAVIFLICSLADLFKKKKKKEFNDFWLQVAVHYFDNVEGNIWAIRMIRAVLRWTGVKAAIIPAGCNRTFHELLGCKLAGIKSVGIQHAAIPQYAFISDFMPEFDGESPLSVDRYGLWSNWWKEYYLSHSRAYWLEQLCVSGPMRPLIKKIPTGGHKPEKELLKVLFISEQLASPKEVMPYLLRLLSIEDFILYLKFRPYRDGFEGWLKDNQPDILKKVRILRGSMEEAVLQCDVVTGSHSTAVLEALLQLKPFVFFWTGKWGDYFGLKAFDKEGRFFASSPEELINYIRKSINTPKEVLQQLQERFFGNPYQNGSKWVVDQALEFAKNYAKK